MRSGSELNANLAGAEWERFAGAQIEWDPGPAPIIDEEFQRDVRFDIGLKLYFWFLPVTGHQLAIDHPGEVLAADDLFIDLLGEHRADGLEQLDLFVTDRFGFQSDRRFHRDEGEDLE